MMSMKSVELKVKTMRLIRLDVLVFKYKQIEPHITNARPNNISYIVAIQYPFPDQVDLDDLGCFNTNSIILSTFGNFF